MIDMQDNEIISKTIILNGRLLKKNGSWMYCNKCNNTVGYLCYTTYQYYKFKFTCTCGNVGIFELGERVVSTQEGEKKALLLHKNRLCCPNDDSPLFSVVGKNLRRYDYEVICKKCISCYKSEILLLDFGS